MIAYLLLLPPAFLHPPFFSPVPFSHMAPDSFSLCCFFVHSALTPSARRISRTTFRSRRAFFRDGAGSVSPMPWTEGARSYWTGRGRLDRAYPGRAVCRPRVRRGPGTHAPGRGDQAQSPREVPG